MILDLAVRGKLVTQDANDEPAAVLLERIKKEKERLVKEKKIRKSKPLPPITLGETLYKIPNNWQWIRLGEIGDWGAGATPDRKNSQYYSGLIKWFKSGELNDGYIINSEEHITELAFKNCSLRLNQPGDVLIAMYGATIGKVAILETQSTTNQAVCACTCFKGFYNLYLFIVLKAYKNIFSSQGAGGAQPNISREKIIHTIAPLPPLAEQKRIVTKVDELMKLCDELEARQKKKRETRILINNAALNKLLTAETPETFTKNWQRIGDNFDILYSAPENIGKLRQAILQLAVMGKLVPQNANDEPAAVLLERIKKEKERLIKEGKIKNEQSIVIDGNLYQIPKQWELVSLNQIIALMDSGWSPACKNHPTLDKSKWGVLKTTAVQPLVYKEEEHKELPEHLEPRPDYEVQVGDLLITRAGPKNRVGICCLVKKTRPKLMISDKIIRFHLFEPFIFPDFIVLILNTGFSQSFIETQKSGMAESQMNISQAKLRMTPIPLPPFNEQKRIVTKVDKLMKLCDELETKLTQTQTESEKIINAAVKQLLMV
ncbi:restriction endonuclease subunit S [Dolichospermum lemmermannii CS-548]|uniref:restriction endonuclease subunit S n=1 Tax=Dolichospermum lemmermannii TaxID=54295 RepID=UPI00232E2161|nr:restriction endonuclease subunit S [Dolichospermum lemmermannii]MDB9435550.1 restriction endonuclease subunit S [Dolichospermum lemmermannii CS-548]